MYHKVIEAKSEKKHVFSFWKIYNYMCISIQLTERNI